MTVPSEGSPTARIFIVGEAPGANEVAKGRPFVGASGQLLDNALRKVGISRSDCFIANVCRERPPGNDITAWVPTTKKAQAELLASGDGVMCQGKVVHRFVADGLSHLLKEIELVNPDLLILLGNTPLFFLTGEQGITKWRGSMLRDSRNRTVVPTLHPAAVLRQWETRIPFEADLRRAVRCLREGWSLPAWNFTVRPTHTQVTAYLDRLTECADAGPLLLSCDIETRAGHISCLGLAPTVTDALCIPFLSAERPDGYWELEDEADIVARLQRLLTHPNVEVVGQNFIFDAQYIYRWWRFIPNLKHDTMLAQHVCFSQAPKSLDYIASLYCDYYKFWKDDGKDWRSIGAGDEDRYWRYNCEDCVRTLECCRNLRILIDRLNLSEPYAFQIDMWLPCLRMMIRGIDVNLEKRKALIKELKTYASDCERAIAEMVGYELNPASSPQMRRFFYEELGLPVQIKRGPKGGPSCDDEALGKLAKRCAFIRPLVQTIQGLRSARTLVANALKDALGWDGKMHSSFNLAGTHTFRLSSSTDAFGSGMNLQNITSGDEE